LSKSFKVPYVFTEYSNYWEYADLNRFNGFESQADHFEFVRSAAVRIAAAELRADGYRRIFGAEFVCIPNLVSRLFETPLVAREKGGVFRFICAAILHDRKRQDILLRAFASAFKGKRASLTLVGNGPREADYRALANSLGIDNQVEFTGIRTREEVRALFDACHVGILASDQETFGIVLTEAMFRGIPVISTRSGGPEEIIGSGRGLLVPVRDERALADAMRRIHADYHSYNAEEIRTWAISKYSEAVIAPQIEAVYRRVCGR
jgi:glycosyltransferase involved in cell wall biosynthesis